MLFACGTNINPDTNTTMGYSYTKPLIDMGKLEFNEKAEYGFEFNNSGSIPLIVYNVKSSCGCIVLNWPKNPVKPNKSGKINITYDTSHSGMFNKTIKIFYNGSNSPVEIRVTGEVGYPDNL